MKSLTINVVSLLKWDDVLTIKTVGIKLIKNEKWKEDLLLKTHRFLQQD